MVSRFDYSRHYVISPELAFECPMPHLRAIHAAHNRIKSVSDALTVTSVKLQSLRLNDNMITRLPNLDALSGLIELDIRNNRMHKLPYTNPSLVTFEIEGNYASTTGPFLGNEHLKRGLLLMHCHFEANSMCLFQISSSTAKTSYVMLVAKAIKTRRQTLIVPNLRKSSSLTPPVRWSVTPPHR